MADIIIFIGKYGCPGCDKFKVEWDKICLDKDISQRVYLRQQIVGRDPADNTVYSMMEAFSNVSTVPTILRVKHRDYIKYFDICDETKQQKIPGIIPSETYSGSMTYSAVKNWIL